MRAAILFLLAALASSACGAGDVVTAGCEASCGSCLQEACADAPPLGWEGPVLFWSGPLDEAPPCPERAPITAYEGYAGLTATLTCPSCSCGPSACLWPEALLAGESCMPGGPAIPYPIPPGWDGSCTSTGIIEGSEYTWLLFPVLPQAPCAPMEGPAAQAQFGWGTMGRACEPVGCDAAAYCAGTPGQESRFSVCIHAAGEQECPAEYPARTLLHGGIDDSDLSCTPCTCGPPEEGLCLAFIDTYHDTACTKPDGGLLVGSTGTACSGGPPEDLGSITGFWYTQQPGTCEPNEGVPLGEARPAQPVTFCCRASTSERVGSPGATPQRPEGGGP